MSTERVQKILAQAGITSRRKAEELISQGLVTINGKVAKLGDKAQFGRDAIKVNGKLIQATESPIYIAFHKPKGVLTTLSDPGNRPTIADYIKKVKGRVFSIGRLGFNSEGLLFLTNDGDFAEKLQHLPQLPRTYHIKIKGHPVEAGVKRLERGGKVGRQMIRPHSVKVIEELASKSVVEIVVLGPGSSDIKELFEIKGFRVERMVRTAIGHITLKGLQPGHYRHLKKTQVDALLKDVAPPRDDLD